MRIKGLPIVRSGLAMPFRAEGDPEPGTASEDGLGELVVRFSPFNTWYEINSFWEGRFLERTIPGAFKKTASDAKRGDGTFSTKVLYNHGMDFNIGDKMLTVPTRFAEMNEDGYHGPELAGNLFDTTYNRDLLPGLQANAYGSSFMFEVVREEWNNEPDPADHNPEGLPERSISEVRTFEAGPVTFPASPTATAGMRSRGGTDSWMERVAVRNPSRYEDLVRSYEGFRTMSRTADFKPGTPTPAKEARRQVDEAAQLKRGLWLRQARIDLMKRGY